MAVTFAADGRVGTITLDNPPANSYDIEMVTELGAAIDAADRRRDVARGGHPQREREVLLRRAPTSRRFLANDVEANMEMIRTAPRRPEPDRRRPASRSSPGSPATRSAAAWRSPWPATCATRRRGASGSARRR